MSHDRMKILSHRVSDVPTTEELELLKLARERTGLVIHARWVLLAILAGYGIVPYIFFQDISADLNMITARHCVFPVIAWSFMATYNAWLHYSYQRFKRIRSLNQIQLLLDLVFVSVVVHASGGAVSWFWTMYLVLTLEAALIMENDSDTYAIALGGMIAYGGLLLFEHYELIPPVSMPFENNALQQVFAYEIIKWGWVSITNLCVAFTGVFMMGTIRAREERLRDLVIRDNLTPLYNHRFFHYRLNSETQRAKRYHRPLSLLILDVDDFRRINDRYGHLAGDEVLRGVAATILGTIRRVGGKRGYEVDIGCRYGGEEFAVILPEVTAQQALATAERLRTSIGQICFDIGVDRIRKEEHDPGREPAKVTVSVGVASYPEYAGDPAELMHAADEAMYAAKRTGKNRVVMAGELFSLPIPAQTKS
jgi:diguanylate cyclase (GGDEF)-like protein